MAGSTLCVSCAQLPVKDSSAAANRQRCPECKSDIGVTSYGNAFRVTPTKRKSLLTPLFITGMTIGVALFMGVVVIVSMGIWMKEQVAPTRPQPAAGAAPAVIEDLARVPEVALEAPFAQNIQPATAKVQLANLVAKIRQENTVKQDNFLIAQMDRRKELRGLPFVMGDACRMDVNRSRSFQNSVQAVRDSLERESGRFRHNAPADEHHSTFWTTYTAASGGDGVSNDAGMAALTQMLAPEQLGFRSGLIQRVATVHKPEATKVLAKAAIFDSAPEVRNSAIKALKDRPKEEATETLMYGLRYPLASVSKRAAVAMIMLDRKDMYPQLVAFLGEAAPADPVETTIENRPACVVREVVRINHHRNCLLCHAPSTTGSTDEVPGVLPIPGQSFPESPRDAYGSAQSTGDPMIRADTTYLRQDFSMMLAVENAAPWPDRQRFDFLVRTRVVEGKELESLQEKVRTRPADHLSENHKAAIRALRELSGHQDVAPTQAAWQRVLGLNHAQR